MHKLETLLDAFEVQQMLGSLNKTVRGLVIDSRKATKDTLFFAWKGSQLDGHRFIGSAIENGASVIVCEKIPDEPKEAVTYLKVEDTLSVIGPIASMWYGYPSRSMKVVGVTGTNGKTSVCTLLFDLFRSLGYKVGLLSTVENKINDEIIPSTHTTPDPVSIQALLEQMNSSGCDYVFMEVSSHSVHQKRIAGIEFDGALFTNISRDHLDYHETFKEYINAKKAFFDGLSSQAFALVNKDDKRHEVMVQNCAGARKTFSMREMADFRAVLQSNSLHGLEMKIDDREFYSPMVGDYNASNLLAAYATAVLLEQDVVEVLTHLSGFKGAKGRFEIYRSVDGPIGIVDYAHTPDALDNVLKAIKDANVSEGKIITVVGCGGDRDKGKRPMMAKIAVDLSAQVILTSDNPRSEHPSDILEDMMQGVSIEEEDRILIIEDRGAAIKTACKLGKKNDIILVAGKGHENYQEIRGERKHFDDAEELKKHLKI